MAQTTTAATTTEPADDDRAGGDDDRAAATTAPKPPAVVPIRVSVPGDKAPTVKRFTIKQGSQVDFVVNSELADEVHLHGYDLSADVAPGAARDDPLHGDRSRPLRDRAREPGLPIAELEVRP